MTNQKEITRWGVMGCGSIAGKFMSSAGSLSDAGVVAVASNTEGRAHAFAEKWNVDKAYRSYEDLVEDPEIDAVYVANTHNFHHQAAILAMEAGKAVLCEKPLAVNARQAMEMVACARRNKVFLMEAVWMRFLPAIAQLREWLDAGKIGEIKQIHASFGIPISHNPRIRDPKLAGGALLDLGIYPLSFASMVMRGEQPVAMHSLCELLDSGVDASSLIQLQFAGGVMADLKCSCVLDLPNTACIIGTCGKIELPPGFHGAEHISLVTKEDTITREYPRDDAEAFKFEITEVQRCLREGLLESPTMPLDETVHLAEVMDRLRAEWGVRYPGE